MSIAACLFAFVCVCVCVCVGMCVCVMQYQSHSPQPFVQGNDRERESQMPTGHLGHSPCHKVRVSDAVQSVNNTAAHPNDPKRQMAGRVVPMCVCVCVCSLGTQAFPVYACAEYRIYLNSSRGYYLFQPPASAATIQGRLLYRAALI